MNVTTDRPNNRNRIGRPGSILLKTGRLLDGSN
jgi:hypothetical protein